MRIKIKTDSKTAIDFGKNSNIWYTEIDISQLTADQKRILKIYTDDDNDELCASNKNAMQIVDKTGIITTDSIDIAAKRLERLCDERLDEKEKEVTRCEKDGLYNSVELKCYSLLSDNYLTQIQMERRDLLQARFDVLTEKHKEVEKQKESAKKSAIVEWDNKLRPEVEKYLAGGDREFPSWVGTWAGSKGENSLFEKIMAEDKKRSALKSEQEDQRKKQQLTEIVNRLGTDLQKKKLEAGLMARSEAINLLWNETFHDPLDAQEIQAYKTDGYIHDQCCTCDDADWDQNEKSTVSDDQFAELQKALSVISVCTYKIFNEIDKNGNEDMITFARLYKEVGEYTLECDIIL